jgi:hypothetical protein
MMKDLLEAEYYTLSAVLETVIEEARHYRSILGEIKDEASKADPAYHKLSVIGVIHLLTKENKALKKENKALYKELTKDTK